MASPKIVRWPNHFDTLEAVLAFARDYWPQYPVYSNLASANTHLIAFGKLIDELRIDRQKVYASITTALAHVTFATSDLYHARIHNQDLQTELDSFKRHNQQLGEEHKLLLAKHETLRTEHAQLSNRLTKAQSRLYEQTDQSTDNPSTLRVKLDFMRIELQEKLDLIDHLERVTKTKPATYADLNGITADDPGVPLSECSEHKE
ncbi:hypothetical protein SARC_03624, partial [Sphaeroforma arctica JP610]